jgi:hypothetical protein
MAGTQKGKRTQSFRGFKSIPRLRTPPAIPTGPRMYRAPRFKGFKGGPGEPPAGFVTGQTSASEWVIYWAMAKVFGEPQDPRQGPFFGFPGVWGYQVGGREQGQAVIDFVVYPNRRSRNLRYGFRVQTEYFHNYADSKTQAYDLMQLWHLSDYNVVVDLYDYEFMYDLRGSAAIILIKRALNGELWSPVTNNSTVIQRVRPARVFG